MASHLGVLAECLVESTMAARAQCPAHAECSVGGHFCVSNSPSWLTNHCRFVLPLGLGLGLLQGSQKPLWLTLDLWVRELAQSHLQSSGLSSSTLCCCVQGPGAAGGKEKPLDTDSPDQAQKGINQALGRNKRPTWSICPVAPVLAKSPWELRSVFSWE